MKLVQVTLLVDENLDSGTLTCKEIADSAISFFLEAQSENPWGGLNGVPVYIEKVLNVNVFDVETIK